jgi:hypothetical protein
MAATVPRLDFRDHPHFREVAMKRSIRRLAIAAAVVAGAALSATLLAPAGRAASPHEGAAGTPPTMQHQPQTTEMHGGNGMPAGAAATLPGQDAFGAVQEIVRILEADPKTDWSKVDLEALRQHLIDMNEVTLRADAAAKPIDGGLEIAVTGAGRTLAAIQRMLPAHAHEIDGQKGWSARTAALPNGVLLTVTARTPEETQHIRGLGFIGILATGAHHQAHHLAIARGEMVHVH